MIVERIPQSRNVSLGLSYSSANRIDRISSRSRNSFDRYRQRQRLFGRDDLDISICTPM
jgi:hypothetical protein